MAGIRLARGSAEYEELSNQPSSSPSKGEKCADSHMHEFLETIIYYRIIGNWTHNPRTQGKGYIQAITP